jgi:predicted RNA methylase
MDAENYEQEQLDYIDKALDMAIEYGLEVEVIYHALNYMKKNPQITPAEAFALGVTEWIK